MRANSENNKLPGVKPKNKNPEILAYTLLDVIDVSEKITSLMHKKNINPALFIHSLILTTQILKKQYKTIPQEINERTKEIKKLLSETIWNPTRYTYY